MHNQRLPHANVVTYEEYAAARLLFFSCARIRALVASLLSPTGISDRFPLRAATLVDDAFVRYCMEEFDGQSERTA